MQPCAIATTATTIVRGDLIICEQYQYQPVSVRQFLCNSCNSKSQAFCLFPLQYAWLFRIYRCFFQTVSGCSAITSIFQGILEVIIETLSRTFVSISGPHALMFGVIFGAFCITLAWTGRLGAFFNGLSCQPGESRPCPQVCLACHPL